MARYRLTVEYDGGPYCGFQAQAVIARSSEAWTLGDSACAWKPQ